MTNSKIIIVGLFSLFITLTLGSKCRQETISKVLLCYYESEQSINHLNICNCTHLIFTSAVKKSENFTLKIDEGVEKTLTFVKDRKLDLSTIFTLNLKSDETSVILKSENKTNELIIEILNVLQESQFDGVELNFNFLPQDGVSKESYGQFVKTLAKTLSSDHSRVKRDGYDVFEKLQDDITTVSYSTQSPKNSTTKPQSIKQTDEKQAKINRKTRDERDKRSQETNNTTSEESIIKELTTELFKEEKNVKKEQNKTNSREYLVFVRLSVEPETVAKKYDLKTLSRYADLLIAPTHNIVNKNEAHMTYHPSRLMGLADMYNTDSILDFLTGVGGIKSKIVITIPATVLKFQLTDSNKNTPKSPSSSDPQVIDQAQLCSLFAKNNWTLERDEDLTAPYAYSGKTWLAFEDEISVNIKGKYILLRELAGGAIYPIDADVNNEFCNNRTGSSGYLTGVLYNNFRSLGRKPRALVLESLQEEIHDSTFSSIEAGVKLSEYRIVRVVDHSGAVHVIRKNTKTQFECSRQGYFSHPLGCNKFYRCVKFDQYSDEFTVFEYDCPAGLAFDERWEVCVWPGSLPHGAPCTGSSEIAPVPRSHYQCPNQEGYYADPENCRWFFACLDHARDGITPLTAYEFRCPFGLVFDQEKLACDWPWLVGSCGNKGAAGYLLATTGGSSSNIHSATFINGGNLEASYGQYGTLEEEASFNNFGKGFGSVLKGARVHNAKGTYQADQSAGFGYIASKYDEDNNRAPFASLPDFEISGGRILNKGGVVLDQNFLGGAGTAEGQVKNFQQNFQSSRVQEGFKGRSNVYNTQDYNTGKINSFYQAPTLSLLQNSGVVEKEVTLLHPISTPKPFSVDIPSVQINEKISDYSGQTVFGSTTPQVSTRVSEFSKTVQQSTPIVSVTQPTASIGVSLVTPKSEINTFEQTISHQNGGFSFSTPAVSYTVTPKPQTHKFDQSAFTQNGISSSVTTGQPSYVPVVTPKSNIHKFSDSSFTQSGVSNTVTAGQPVLYNIQGVTPKPHGFVQPAFTQSGVSGSVTVGQPLVSVTATESSQYSGSGNRGVSVQGSGLASTPVVTPKPAIQSFGSTGGAYNGVYSSSHPAVSTGIPSVSFIEKSNRFEQNKLFSHGSGVSTTEPRGFKNFGEGVVLQNVVTEQPAISFGSSPTTPTFTSTGEQGGVNFGAKFSTLAPKTFTNGFQSTSIDYEISRELNFNKGTNQEGISVVTPKSNLESIRTSQPGVSTGAVFQAPNSELHIISGNVQNTYLQDVSDGKVSFETPLSVPKTNLNSYGYYNGQTNRQSTVTPIAPVNLPVVTPKTSQVNYNLQSDQTLGGFAGASYNKPVTISKTEINDFNQKLNFQGGDVSVQSNLPYGVPGISSRTSTYSVDHSSEVFQNSVQPVNKFGFGISQPIHSGQAETGQQLSHSTEFSQPGVQFSAVKPFETEIKTSKPSIFVPSAEKSNVLTHVSIEQQPIISVGTISSVGYDKEASPPRVFTSSGFTSDSSVVNNKQINFKSGFTQIKPSYPSFTTPAPVVSITPTTQVFYEQNQQTSKPSNADVFPKVPRPVFHKPQQVDIQLTKTNIVSSSPFVYQTLEHTPKVVNFEEKQIAFNQGAESFTPAPQISTPGSIKYQQVTAPAVTTSTVQKQSSLYLPPVTPRAEIFGTKIQDSRPQTPATVFSYKESFGSIGTQRIGLQPSITQNLEFSNRPLVQKTEQRVESIQYQTPASVRVLEPKITIQQPAVTTVKPDIEISKPAEVDSSSFFNSANRGYYQPTTTKSLVIQQQPVQLISEKTLQEKQLYQSFYQQPTKDTLQSQINLVPDNRNQEENVPLYGIHFNSPKSVYEENQYLQSAVKSKSYESPISYTTSKPYVSSISYTTTKPSISPISYTTIKNTIYKQPSVQFEENVPAIPVVQTTYTGQKETVQTENRQQEYLPPVSSKTVDQYNSQNPQVSFQQELIPKSNVILSVSTPASVQSFSPLTEEISIQQNSNFDFQKISKQKEQNIFKQPSTFSTIRPVPAFRPSEQLFQFNTVKNFTFETGRFGSGAQYSINPNIEIPEPPKEYFLQQNIYTTTRPEYATRSNQYKPTLSPQSDLKEFTSSTYLPPEGFVRKRPSSKTIISVGNSDEHDVHEDNIRQILDKVSGGFGNVINNDNEQFVTKVVSGNGKGEIKLGKEGSSTVLYEVSSTTTRPRSRGRQYHGSLTSGIPATNKYEEYEIERDGQRSYDTDTETGSKTTIDLKNLKLDKNKKTVIVVSQVSDANPILIGKLAGQCSCQSNMLELKTKNKKTNLRRKNQKLQNGQQQSDEYLPAVTNIQTSNDNIDSFTPRGSGPETVVVGGGNGFYQTEQSVVSSTSTAYPEVTSSSILSSLGPDGVLSITPKTLLSEDKVRNKKKHFRGRARYLPSAADFGSSEPLLSPVPASEIASTVDYAMLKGDESRTQNEIEGGGVSRVLAGAAFDRYGPGGWRGFDETLQGSVDCKRPGLFRHPKYCNKFYACNYDPWKEGYTLHVFNCPIRLTYDSSISACNWPIRGPACADDNLLV